VQVLGDHVNDLKIAVYDGALCHTMYFVGYILQWRSFPLSATILAALVGVYVEPPCRWFVVPLLLVLLHVLLAFEGARKAMTIGSMNAPFSQEGLELVARWRSTAVMERYLRRVVEHDLQGQVIDDEGLGGLAACCFGGAGPKVRFRELREALKRGGLTDVGHGELEAGDLVNVDGHRKAMVLQAARAPGEPVRVKYDDRSEDLVHAARAVPRMKLPYLPDWLIPQSMREQIRHLEYVLGRLSTYLLHAVYGVDSVLTWRRPWASLLVDLLCLTVCTYSCLIYFDLLEVAWKWLLGVMEFQHWILHLVHNCTKFLCRLRDLSWWYIRLIFHWSVLASLVFVYTFWANWLVEVRAVVKVCYRLLSMPRKGPHAWAFFRESDEAGSTKFPVPAGTSLPNELT